MIVGSHQLNLMPWPGFFHKMLGSDLFVLNSYDQADDYVRRVRFTHPRNGDWWFSIPTKPRGVSIVKTRLSHDYHGKFDTWGYEVWNKLHESYRDAPFWGDYEDILHELIVVRKETSVHRFNLAFVHWIRDEVLGSDTPLVIDFPRQGQTVTDRILNMLQRFNSCSYVMGESGPNYLDHAMLDLSMNSESRPINFWVQVIDDYMGGYSTVHYLLTEGPDRTKEIVEGFGKFIDLKTWRLLNASR